MKLTVGSKVFSKLQVQFTLDRGETYTVATSLVDPDDLTDESRCFWILACGLEKYVKGG